MLGNGLATDPSHAYLFHGPAGTGKREVARAFAAELLAAGSADPADIRLRVEHGTHPDLTWVRPSGAHQMLVSDVDQAVVNAATRTPFEAARRVFVLERVDTLIDQAANRLLKTLEEPAPFVHLILLTDALGRVMETVVSRCQLVRFEPLPEERIVERLAPTGIDASRARACARLALGNADRASYLASPEGEAVRAEVEAFVASALGGGEAPGDEPWRALLARAEARRRRARRRSQRWRATVSSWSRRAATAERSRRSSRRWRSARAAERPASRSSWRST